MRSLSELVSEVKREAPGCRKVLVERALLDITRELCRQTHIWKRKLPDLDFGEAGCARVYFTVGGNCGCVQGVPDDQVWCDDLIVCDDKVLQPVPDAIEIVSLHHPLFQTPGECIIEGIEWDIGEQVITATSDVPGTTFTGLEASLMPTGMDVADVVFRYDTTVKLGAVWKLLSMSGMSWSDNTRAKQAWHEYERGRIEAQNDAGKGFVNKPMRVNRTRLRGAP